MIIKTLKFKGLILGLLATMLFTSCDDTEPVVNPFYGAVYAMTNSATDNKVFAYGRASNGTLTPMAGVSTGGKGIGTTVSAPGAGTIDPLASNYALILNASKSLVFAVNAGSHEISSFAISPTDFSLKLVETISSGGTKPISLAVVGNNLFVLNENGGTGQINSFTFNAAGDLTAVTGSARNLPGRPLSIKASQDGKHLITTILPEKVVVYDINGSSLSTSPTATVTVPKVTGGNAPAVPFGIETISLDGKQYVFTSDARGGMSETSTVTSYTLNSDGTLTSNGLVSLGANPTMGGEVAACWIVGTGSSLYTSNTGSSTISSLAIANDGTLSVTKLKAFKESAAPPQSGLTDLAVVGKYVYQLYSAVGEVHVLSRNSDGSLTFVESEKNLVSTGGNQGIIGF